jgi:glyoxylase-like metal-dependent hydrolase (beta-lactamase superfamily II)
MRAAGLAPESVAFVVLSDMHFDHAGEVESFPNAQVVVARTERQAALNATWYDAYFPADYDEVPRWLEIDYREGEPFGTFAAHHDLLGDGSVVLVDVHGHSPGSQGVVIRTEFGPVLIVGDAAALDESWRYASRPAYAYDARAWWEQVWRIKKFVDLVPSATVIPGHDLDSLTQQSNAAVVLHDPQRSAPEVEADRVR